MQGHIYRPAKATAKDVQGLVPGELHGLIWKQIKDERLPSARIGVQAGTARLWVVPGVYELLVDLGHLASLRGHLVLMYELWSREPIL
jgi:hypothetical protein